MAGECILIQRECRIARHALPRFVSMLDAPLHCIVVTICRAEMALWIDQLSWIG